MTPGALQCLPSGAAVHAAAGARPQCTAAACPNSCQQGLQSLQDICPIFPAAAHCPPHPAQLPALPLKDHARHRWLLNLDGISASSRFGQLLHTNSVVLKMRSKYIEYYDRWVAGWLGSGVVGEGARAALACSPAWDCWRALPTQLARRSGDGAWVHGVTWGICACPHVLRGVAGVFISRLLMAHARSWPAAAPTHARALLPCTHASLCASKSLAPAARPPCRALQPGHHYLEFWVTGKDDIYDIVPQLNKEYEANATRFHHMAQEAQDFASKFLSPRARFLYWRAAILAYRAMLPDMDQHVAQMVKHLKESGKLKDDGSDLVD